MTTAQKPGPVPGTDFSEIDHPAATIEATAVTAWGLDYAWGWYPAFAQVLVSNQAAFVCRYLSEPGTKGINRAELAALEAAGIMVCPNWEVSGNDFTGGYNAGFSDGQAAAAALRALGAPAGTYCWYSIDAQTSDTTDTGNYLRGAKDGSAEYVAQLYGPYNVVEAAAAAGLGSSHWQTYAWSGGQLSSHAALYQYQNGVTIGGVSTDRDKALQPLGSGPWANLGGAPATDWTTEVIMSLPMLQQGSADHPGSIMYVHRAQALVKVIGQINGITAASGLATDGNFGASTKAGVQAVQSMFGITSDGIVGQNTWTKLIEG